MPSVATLRADPEIVRSLRAALGTPLTVTRTATDGRMDIEVHSYSPLSIAHHLAGFGSSVEVMAPLEVRDHSARIASELCELYRR